MIGLKRGTVKLSRNKPEYSRSFEREKEKLIKILGVDATIIQHVGSTAIPYILAKPIIDIGIVVKSLSGAKKYIGKLKNVGYILKQEDRSDRLFFTKGPENGRTHYLHVGELGSGYVEDMILFRDYLKEHRDIAKKYEELKKRLADLYSENRELYTSKKEEFIIGMIKESKKF